MNKRASTNDTLSEISGGVLSAFLIATVGSVFLVSLVLVHFGGDDRPKQFDNLALQVEDLLRNEADFAAKPAYIFPARGVLIGFDRGTSVLQTRHVDLDLFGTLDELRKEIFTDEEIGEAVRIKRPRVCRSDACLCLFELDFDEIVEDSEGPLIACERFEGNVKFRSLQGELFMLRDVERTDLWPNEFFSSEYEAETSDAWVELYPNADDRSFFQLHWRLYSDDDFGVGLFDDGTLRSQFYIEKIIIDNTVHIGFAQLFFPEFTAYLDERIEYTKVNLGLTLEVLRNLHASRAENFEEVAQQFIEREQNKGNKLIQAYAEALLADFQLVKGEDLIDIQPFYDAFEHAAEVETEKYYQFIKEHLFLIQRLDNQLELDPRKVSSKNSKRLGALQEALFQVVNSEEFKQSDFTKADERILVDFLMTTTHLSIVNGELIIPEIEKPTFFTKMIDFVFHFSTIDPDIYSIDDALALTHRVSRVQRSLETQHQTKGFDGMDSMRARVLQYLGETLGEMVTNGVLFDRRLSLRDQIIDDIGFAYSSIEDLTIPEAQVALRQIEITACPFFRFELSAALPEGVDPLCPDPNQPVADSGATTAG